MRKRLTARDVFSRRREIVPEAIDFPEMLWVQLFSSHQHGHLLQDSLLFLETSFTAIATSSGEAIESRVVARRVQRGLEVVPVGLHALRPLVEHLLGPGLQGVKIMKRQDHSLA
ncbi:hypothetical protein [Streptomyces griseoluteus]|uniref:hypothetical protein n=1 Tax=Streptomyces griseoluteus TaxID=29306 RepID=UPI00332962F9